jgi:hypothetical protein
MNDPSDRFEALRRETEFRDAGLGDVFDTWGTPYPI